MKKLQSAAGPRPRKQSGRAYRAFAWIAAHPRCLSGLISLFAILLSLVAAAVMLLLLGKNPLAAFLNLLQGAGIVPKSSYAAHKGVLTDLMSTVDAWTPMLFAALAVAVALRAGLFNIGVSGQMLASGFVATAVVGYLPLAPGVAKPLVLLVGLVVGAAVGAFIGWLKYRFNVNEVVSSIMLNYIVQYIVSFCITTYYINPVSRQSRYVSAASRLTLEDVPLGGLQIALPLAAVLAVAVAFVIRFLLDRTRLGFEMKTVGHNRLAAQYAGIHVGRNLVVSMLLSGGLSGLAGVSYYLGYYGSIQPRVLTSVGFDAIAVSLLGNSHPIGILFASFLITVITKGSVYMSSMQGVRQEIASVITGLILLFSACAAFFRYLFDRSVRNLREKAGVQAEEERERT